MRFARGQRIGIARARNDKLGAVTPDVMSGRKIVAGTPSRCAA
jgi:hypothetical protein